MKKYRTPLIALNLIVLLVFFVTSVIKKERTLNNGRLVLLELAPVDPRSLIQGDYMQLNYAITAQREYRAVCSKGVSTIMVNDSNIVTELLLNADKPSSSNSLLLKYGCNGNQIHLGAESYFFEEGSASKYDNAKYGGLRVDDAGNSILVGLYDVNLKLIE